jgi:hypothetical protein
MILEALGSQSLTDREIMRKLDLCDPNAIRPRVTEMIASGVLVEDDFTIDAESKKTVRRVRVAAIQRSLF